MFGKALTNGLNPLSGVGARASFRPMSSAGIHALDVLVEHAWHGGGARGRSDDGEHDYEATTRRKGGISSHNSGLHRRYPKVIGHTDGMGMALRMEICGEDGYQPDRELTDRIFAEGMKGDLMARGKRMGLVLDVGGYYKNVFTLAPSFEITEGEIDLGIELLEQLIRRCAPGRV